MIKSFSHKGLEVFFRTGSTKGIQSKHKLNLGLILDQLNSAEELRDMNYPGSGFHPLKGKYKDFYAVSVSGNWRIIFKYEDGHAYQVGYVDYH